MANKIVIAELDIDVNSMLKATADLKKNIQDLKDAQKVLTITGKQNSEEFVQNASDLKVLTSAYNQNIKAIGEQTQASKTEAQQAEILNAVLNQEVTTIKEARDQNKLLNKLRNETNVTTEEGKKQLTDLNAKLDSNNAFVKENADQYLQQKLNIGNYSSALSGLSPQLDALVTQGQAIYSGLVMQKEALIATSTTMGGVSKASNVLKIALISTGIGAIAVALGALVTYLTSTQAGMDKVTAVTRPLQAIFQSLLGVVQNVGKYLFEAFSNPKQLLTDLADFVKTNLINRFKAFGVILEGLMNLDFKQVTNGVLQAGTGVENLTDKISDASKATKEFLDEAVKRGQQIDAITKGIEKSEINLNKERAISEGKIKELQLISKNTALNTTDRVKAQQEIVKLAQEEATKEGNILKLKIERLTIEQELNDTNREGNKELADLEAQLQQTKNKAKDAELEGIRVIATAMKEARAKETERANKRTEQELNASKQRIDLFIAEQGFRKKSTEEEYLFNKEIQERELKDLDLRYKKGKVSKLEYETEKLNITNDFLKSNADLLLAEGQRELDIIKANANLGLDAKLEAERTYQDIRLEQGEINEREYQDAIDAINTEYDQKRKDKKLEDEALERDRKAINLENEREANQLTFEQDVEIEREQNEIKLQEELLEAEKSGADMQLIKDKYAKYDSDLTQKVNDYKLESTADTFGKLSNLFGTQSKLGKAFALYQAGIDGYQAVMKAFNSQFIPGDPTSLPRAIGAGALAGAFSAKQIAGIAGAKFEKGGIQEVGGNRHSQGGTVFRGSDGTVFEAEKGEGIGILNRSAYSSFMDFNNRFGNGSSSNGFFQGGGIITQGVKQPSIDLNSVVDAIASMPAPQVAVSEIASVGNQYKNVVVNADL